MTTLCIDHCIVSHFQGKLCMQAGVPAAVQGMFAITIAVVIVHMRMLGFLIFCAVIEASLQAMRKVLGSL